MPMKSKQTSIHFILTGGTIDSSWDNQMDSIALNQQSDVPVYFQKFRTEDELMFTEVCLKDSRQLTDKDLHVIVQTIERSPSDKIIITHGRFTILDTVNFLSKHLKKNDKTIILTGGTTPLKGFEMSDSPFNLGFAIAKVQDQPPGIYIGMKGKLFSQNDINNAVGDEQFLRMFK
jgi:L-asparaginase